MLGDIHSVPHHRASGLVCYRGEDAHARGLACPIRSKKTEPACAEFEREIPQSPEIMKVLFTDILNGLVHTGSPITRVDTLTLTFLPQEAFSSPLSVSTFLHTRIAFFCTFSQGLGAKQTVTKLIAQNIVNRANQFHELGCVLLLVEFADSAFVNIKTPIEFLPVSGYKIEHKSLGVSPLLRFFCLTLQVSRERL